VTVPGIEAALRLAGAIADRLASPAEVRGMWLARGWWPQSLADGAASVALLLIERARAGVGAWRRAHDWLACAAEREVPPGRITIRTVALRRPDGTGATSLQLRPRGLVNAAGHVHEQVA
jgi:hypothetical protein